MAATGTVSFMLVFFLATLSVPGLLPHRAAALEDFHRWCEKTSHSGTCIYVILSDPRTDLRTSPSGFCTILKDKAKAVAAATTSKISKLLSNATNPRLKRVLESCAWNYNEGVAYGLNLDFSQLNHENYLGFAVALAAAFDETTECERTFKEDPSNPIESPLTVENKNLGNIVITTAEILNLNECNKTAACNYNQ